jgi:hypothetical protein
MAPLSSGQRTLLEQLAADGARVWRSPKGFHLIRPIGDWVTLPEGTVMGLVHYDYLRQVETYGRDRGLYEITDVGRQTLALTRV